jgi:dTMP kinase
VARQRGKFITFEGLDGVGKSTQLENLAGWLRRRGLEVITTREPGGTALGEKLRTVLLSSRTAGLSPMTELALMFADRAQHVEEQILPALQHGQWVLCDRFTDSSEAYQGGGRELGSELVLGLHRALCRDLQPDLTILMVSDVARIVARARRRNLAQAKGEQDDENRFEKENRAFYDRVLAAYMAIAKRAPQRVVPVDARDAVDKVHEKIIAIVEERLSLPRESKPARKS